MIYLAIYSIALGMTFVFLLRKYLNLRSAFHTMQVKKDSDILALEIGKDELQETYEQQFLSHMEKISMLSIQKRLLEEELEVDKPLANWHRDNCLPVLEHIRAENTHAVVQDNLNQ